MQALRPLEVHFAGVQMAEAEQAAARRSVDKWIGNFVAHGQAHQQLGARLARHPPTGASNQLLSANPRRSVDDGFHDRWLAQAGGAAAAVPLSTGDRNRLRLPIRVSCFHVSMYVDLRHHDSFANRKEELASIGVDDYWHSFASRQRQARPAAAYAPLHRHSSGGSGLFFRRMRAPAVLPSVPLPAGGGGRAGSGLAECCSGFVEFETVPQSGIPAMAWTAGPGLADDPRSELPRLVRAGPQDPWFQSCRPAVRSSRAGRSTTFRRSIPTYYGFSAINPAQAGTGLKIKTVEALAFRRCVVTTPAGAEGVEDLVGKGIIVGATPAAFSAAVTDLLRDPARAAALGELGHREIGKLNGLNRAGLQAVLSIPSQGGTAAVFDATAAHDAE